MSRVASSVFHLHADARDEYDVLSQIFFETLHGQQFDTFLFERMRHAEFRKDY